MTVTELTIGDIVYYVVPGGRPTLDAHPNECPLILYNKPLDEIMRFGDLWRERGRTPCVIIPSPSLGGNYANAWNGHDDPAGLLDNIASHIDGYIVDFANTATPELPSVWKDTKEYPQFIFWERKNQEIYFRGSHNQFIAKFGFDPEVATPPTSGGTTTTGDTGTTTGGSVTIPSNIKVELHIYNHGDVE